MTEHPGTEEEAVAEGDTLGPASADVAGAGIDADIAADADAAPSEPPAEEVDYQRLAAERTEDLQRLQAEYVNYKKRVDRDRSLARQSGIESVMADMMPVLDAIALAKQHDDLADGGKMIIAELEKVTTKHGLQMFGEVGEAFDPVKHEALMQVPLDEPVEVATVSQVIQPGFELAGRVLRPARVAVANP